jgi:hypothetical protein
MAKVIAWNSRIPEDTLYVYPGERRWKHYFFGEPTFHTPDYMAIDQRSKYTFEAIGTAKAMVVAAPGQGSQYAGIYEDSTGAWLIGGNTYRVHLPPGVPVTMFWSLTAYDNETRSLIQNDLGRPLVGSVHSAIENADGSFDCYFGPELPDGVPVGNWVQTKVEKGFFVMLRLYGPTEPWFDKTWIPGDATRLD